MLHRLLLLGYLTGVAFVTAHLINGVVADALISPTLPPVIARPTSAEPSIAADVTAMADEILAAGLFAIPPGLMPTAGAVARPSSVVPAPPLEAAKKIKLVGTVLTDGRDPFAVIEELSSKRQTLYHLHDDIADVGQVAEIHSDGIVIERDGQREFLEAGPGQAAAPAGMTAKSGAPATSASSLRIVDRREVTQSMTDLPKLLSQARVVPFYANEKLAGWRIDAIAPASVFDKIGLRSGDVLQRVNGVEIREPSMMLTLLQQVKDEKHVRLDVLRNSQPLSFRYEIR